MTAQMTLPAQDLPIRRHGTGSPPQAPTPLRRPRACGDPGLQYLAPEDVFQQGTPRVDLYGLALIVCHLSCPPRHSYSLRASALASALEGVVARHEILRTCYPTTDGYPGALILSPGDVALPVTDLTDLPETQREQRARKLVRAECRKPFDIAHGPLLRALLLRLGDQQH